LVAHYDERTRNSGQIRSLRLDYRQLYAQPDNFIQHGYSSSQTTVTGLDTGTTYYVLIIAEDGKAMTYRQ